MECPTQATQSCEEPCSCHQFTDDGLGRGSGLLMTPVSRELRLETLSVCSPTPNPFHHPEPLSLCPSNKHRCLESTLRSEEKRGRPRESQRNCDLPKVTELQSQDETLELGMSPHSHTCPVGGTRCIHYHLSPQSAWNELCPEGMTLAWELKTRWGGWVWTPTQRPPWGALWWPLSLL